MKYVVMQDESGKETIFIFDESIHHDCAEEVFGRIKDQTHGRWNRVFRTPVAAGFTNGICCWGESETLKLKSRGIQDEELIK